MSETKIAFLADSGLDIPQELADKYGIDIVGFPINLDGKEYLERRDMTNQEFYEMMREAKGVPTTAAITQLQWLDVYANYVDQGVTDLVHMTINSAGSSTYSNAVKAAEMLNEERPGHKMKIHLIDSHTYSMPGGWYLCECARKVRNAGDLQICLREVQDKLTRVEVCLAAFSLKQMKKSGRVTAAAAVVGDLMGIRPIISLNDGISKVESKVRGDASVPPAMVKWVKSRVDNVRDMDYMVAYTSSTEKRDELLRLCRKEFGHAPVCVFELGGVVSANTGPDAIAIAFEGKPRRLADYAVPLP
ncbi:MAG: DegV family protein [Gemmiger sp.]|uniref:DegV family protein n=1 Tax=Gemmiger sp. TaxID=2049027 RepID=UPI002E778722|nr:DegV family protein [Gemmiger sp.]MEE0801677.1 DegV family protein [Gemmiger sp.]